MPAPRPQKNPTQKHFPGAGMTDAQMESFIWDLATWQIADWNYICIYIYTVHIHGIKGEIGIPKSVLNLLLIFVSKNRLFGILQWYTMRFVYIYTYAYVYVYIKLFCT